MIRFIYALAAVLVLSSLAWAQESEKKDSIKISANDKLLSEVAKDIAQQANISIVVDPKADSKITTSVSNIDLAKALDLICKSADASWKKVQLAKSATDKVTLDQLKSSIVALASMPVAAISVQDNEGKSSSVFAKSVPVKDDVSGIKLADGYKWQTFYVIIAKTDASSDIEDETASSDSDTEKIDPEEAKKLAGEGYNKARDLANMSSDERRAAYKNEMMGYMGLTTQARRALMADEINAAKDMDPRFRNQYFKDLRSVLRGAGINTGSSRPSNRSTPKNNVVIPAR